MQDDHYGCPLLSRSVEPCLHHLAYTSVVKLAPGPEAHDENAGGQTLQGCKAQFDAFHYCHDTVGFSPQYRRVERIGADTGTRSDKDAYQGVMEGARFAVLDVETTSGDPREGQVMEVAGFAMDDMTERLRWSSLVRPLGSVPPFIRRLTGLTDAMLKDAPRFHEVVKTLETITQDRVVVAHNVRFDMTALEHEFARTGLVFDRYTLCTERLSRRLIPALSHYNLGSICRHLGIPFHTAHRALSDAEATAKLLAYLLTEHGHDVVMEQVNTWPQPVND